MAKLMKKLGRALTASPPEWQTRTAQAWFTAKNRWWSRWGTSALRRDGHLRSLTLTGADLGRWWQARPQRWFWDAAKQHQLEQNSFIEATQIPWVLQQAELVCQGKMPLFSYDPISFQRADRWHHDGILNVTAPNTFYGDVPYLDVVRAGDSKHVWEPNRFGWAYWLGIAYNLTGDSKYAEKFAELSHDWFDKNPYPQGINYASALELAFRNYAWIWSLDLFSRYLKNDVRLVDRILRGLWMGARHIEANLSTYFSPNTHLIGEAFGLYATGAALPEFSDATRWRQLGLEILGKELKRQFYEDGTHRELSTGYHIYSTDFYLHTVLIGNQTGFRVSEQISRGMVRMVQRLSELAPQNLILPSINDCDGGSLIPLVASPLDAGPTLITAQNFLSEPLVRDTPPRGYPLLMTVPASGQRRTASANTTPANPPISYNRNLARIYDSGITCHKNQEGDYLLFRAAEFGLDCAPHSHDAPLGIVLHFGGQPIFVDNGCGAYTQSSDQRNRFRSAMGKNTILVEQRGPSIPDDWFSWKRRANAELISTQRFRDGYRGSGKHVGFSGIMPFHVAVQRDITMLDCGVVVILDSWDADQEILSQSRFTIHPDVTFDMSKQQLLWNGRESAPNLELPLTHAAHVRSTAICETSNSVSAIMKQEHISYSSNYGQESITSVLTVTPSQRTRRGKLMTIVAKQGIITQTGPSDFLVTGIERIQISLLHGAVEVTKSEEVNRINTYLDNISVEVVENN